MHRWGTLCSWFQTILQYMLEIALTCVQPVEISIHHLYDLSVTHVLSGGTLRLSFSVFSVLLSFVLFFFFFFFLFCLPGLFFCFCFCFLLSISIDRGEHHMATVDGVRGSVGVVFS